MIVYPFSFIKSAAELALSNTDAPLLDLTYASSGYFTDFGNPVDESKYLNVSNGSWIGSPTSFNYQWFRNTTDSFSGGVTLSGYTSATYSLRWVDVGQYVYCQVTANKTGVVSVIAGSDFRYVFDYDYYENLQTSDANNSITSIHPSDYQELISKQNDLMVELKNDNIWDKLDAFFVFASPGDSYYAMQNWKDPTAGLSYNDGCTYKDLIGFQGGSDPMFSPPYAFNLNTGFNPEDHGVNYTQDDASRFFFPATFSDASNYPMDGMNGEDLINTMQTGNSSANRINTGDSLSSAFNFDRHLLNAKSIHRTSGSDVTLYNGGSSASRTATSDGGKAENGNMLILRVRETESLHTVAGYALGSSLVAEAVDFNAAWNRYAVGIGIPGYQ